MRQLLRVPGLGRCELVRDWLGAGCCRVWVVDPQTRTVTVHRSPGEIVVLSECETLADEELLPGFGLPVAEIFAAQGGKR